MVRKLVIFAAIAAALAVPAVARAHGGHAHKVMGTVSSVDGNHITVKTADGKSVMVMIDAKTAITRGKTKLDAASLKLGDRVVAEGAEEKEMIMATVVRVGAQTATTAKK